MADEMCTHAHKPMTDKDIVASFLAEDDELKDKFEEHKADLIANDTKLEAIERIKGQRRENENNVIFFRVQLQEVRTPTRTPTPMRTDRLSSFSCARALWLPSGGTRSSYCQP
jgi:membrane-bound ClpP family serine protease